MILSIIIPCYNEKPTILEVLERLEQISISNIKKEIIIVDDGSVDGTVDLLKNIHKRYKVVFHSHNQGKGAAIRSAMREVTGDIVLIQDADLEYHPEDIPRVIAPIIDNRSKAVYGTRIHNYRLKRFSGYSYYFGGKLLTWITNVLYDCRITDEATGYKAFLSSVLKNIELESKGFEFCPEVTAKLLRSGIQIVEVPILYSPRTLSEGKKIRFRDGVMAIWTLVKYRFVRRDLTQKDRA